MIIPWDFICCGNTGWFYKLDYNSFKKLLNENGLHEMVLSPFMCSPPSIIMETYKPNLLTLGQLMLFIRRDLKMADQGT